MRENQHVEWKETWRDEHLRWVCAFANAEGGVLEIGRNNRGVAFALAAGSGGKAGRARVETPVETLVETQEKIIALMARHPAMRLAEIALAIVKSASALERASARLVAEGRGEQVGALSNVDACVSARKAHRARTHALTVNRPAIDRRFVEIDRYAVPFGPARMRWPKS